MDEQTNILLVDDHPENLTTLEAVLESLGQRLVKATSAHEALKCLIHDDFAVILLDVQMPGMDGLEAANLIRQRQKSRATPIIFLTALNRSDFHIAEGYAAGAVDYILKPFDPVILKAKVAAFVEMAKNMKALEAEVKRRQKAEEEITKLNADLERRVLERTAHIEALSLRLQQMIAEMHDRVRNNLQILTAMVDMQRMELRPSVTRAEELDRLGTHIRVLSLVHDLLMEQGKEDAWSSLLPLSNLLEKVIGLLYHKADDRALCLEVAEVLLESRQATSFALVVIELCSNAIKHGEGEVVVAVEPLGKEVKLEVRSGGVGFAPDFDPRNMNHTGLQLVQDLTRHDLGGKIHYENPKEGGAKVVVTFPHMTPGILERKA